MTFTPEQIDAAIEAEVADWERFFDEPATEEGRETRRRFHRANVSQGHLGALKRYLGVFPVLTYRLEEAVLALHKLAKKAERYGTGKITWKIGEFYKETHRNSEGRKVTLSYTDLILEGLEAPRVGDFTFIAKAEITEDGVIVDTVPGEAIPAGAREKLATGCCEHCHNNRQRKDVFLVREAGGKVVQVGRTCLRDYMGTDTPASVAARFRWERELLGFDEEFGGRGKALPDAAEELLAVTAAAIRIWGWVPKSAPESAGEPTALRIAVWYWCSPSDKKGQADRKALGDALEEKDWETARATMEWVATPEAGDSEYIQNLRVILAAGAVAPKRRGYACSAVAAYQRHLGALEQQRRQKEEAANNPSTWVGEKGERLKGLKLLCESAREMPSRFGLTILYKLKDEDGNLYSWFSSGGADMDPGHEYTLDATVKDHGEYRGVRETQLTRAKVL
jgi:hypothetical protein